jgi:tRNA (pseudouridine54-N1)-methyltransferase
VRSFILVGQTAVGSPDFSLDDLPGSSGRLDILLRALQSALLISHGLRRDTLAYLVLLGTPGCPSVVRVDGRVAEFLRPDERSLGGRIKNALGWKSIRQDFSEDRQGIAVARGGIELAIADLEGSTPFVLEEAGVDVRAAELTAEHPTFFVGDHLGFDRGTRERIERLGATAISVGPIRLHADQAIVVLHNELDRREPLCATTTPQ